MRSILFRSLAVAALLMWAGAVDAAAQSTITGSVMRAVGGTPLPGAQVSIPDLQIGALTNSQGRFEIRNVPSGTHNVEVNLIGFTSASETVTLSSGESSVLQFLLEESAISVEGVVVTALGISRDERALGYSVQGVQGEELNEAREPNILNSLSGRLAGVQVKNTGPLGGSSNIVLRGYSSISGNNEPLFIVDGVPIDNTTERGDQGSSGAIDYGNAAQDINPDDIESISVLKGANAAAIYGSRAANGVILITTKKGRNATGLGISASTNMTFDTPMRIPLYQNEYGGGATSNFFQFVDGAGGGTNDGVDESWGPALNGQIYDQWDGTHPWLSNPHSVRQYYELGATNTTNFSVSGATDRLNMRLSGTRLAAKGMSPYSGLDRNTLSLNAGYQVTDALNLSGGAIYTLSEAENRPIGSGGSLDSAPYQWMWWQRQLDMNALAHAVDVFEANGSNWPEGHPGFGLPDNWNHNYWDNPYWIAEYKTNNDRRDRLTGHVEANYDFTDWLSVMARSGMDMYEHQTARVYPLYSHRYVEGGFQEGTNFTQEINTEVLATADFAPTDAFTVTLRGGGNQRINQQNVTDLETLKLNLPEIYNPSNSAIPPTLTYGDYNKQVNSLYGLATLGYNNYLFLDLTGRNDWSSTLPDGENSYFYPSVSSSFVFTEAMPNLTFGGLLDYGKLRASWAKVGNDADPYQLASVLGQYDPAFNGVVSYTVSDTLANSALRPEQTVSWEIGAEARFGQRFNLDVTYYNSTTEDQILPVQISHTTGYRNKILNAGSVSNKGIEAVLQAEILNRDGFSWAASANFAKNSNEVVSLHEDVETLILGSFAGLTVEARRGYPYGVLFGQVYDRNDNGDILVTSQGRPMVAPQKVVIGNFQPEWLAGLENTFRIQGVNISFLLDHRHGGSILCGTCRLGNRTGVLVESLEGRENGVIVDGVFADGTPNNIALPGRSYWGSPGIYNVHEEHVYDATFTKLREVRVGFSMPERIIDALPLSSAYVTLTGRNLGLWTNVPHIDPENDANYAVRNGVEYVSLPSPRSLGINISVTR